MSCTFTDGELYECNLRIHNPAAVNDFLPITGEHFLNLTDNDVGFVQIYRQTSPNFPSIICAQFPNLEEIFIDSSGFNQLNEDSFNGCDYLWLIFISFNQLLEIPSRAFVNNPNLLFLYLRGNQIRRINDGAFDGTQIEAILLDSNHLTAVEGSWFASVRETLQLLDLSWNRIESLSENSFGELPNLSNLRVDGNNLTSIADGAFSGLSGLELLSLSDCKLTEFSSRWFAESSPLRNLVLDRNSINSLDAGAFDIFQELFYVNLNFNQLTVMDSLSFGRSLRTLTSFNAIGNQINAIDPQIFDNVESLQNLILLNNVCVQRSFTSVMSNLDYVRQELAGCFENFVRVL